MSEAAGAEENGSGGNRMTLSRRVAASPAGARGLWDDRQAARMARRDAGVR